MSVGTGTALAIGLGANAGLGLVGAKKSANAAKGAAKTQQAAADKAMAFQTQQFQQALDAQRQQYAATQQLYAPYANSSPASLAALHEFLGIPGAAQNQTAVPPGGYGPPMMQMSGQLGGRPPMGGPPPGMQPGMPGMGQRPPMMMPGQGGMGSMPPGMPPDAMGLGGGRFRPRQPMSMSQMYGQG